MIIETILNLLLTLLTKLFSWINLPSFGEDFQTAIDYIDVAFDNAQSLVAFFLPWNFLKGFLPVIVAIANFQHIYNFIMWILRKIPMLGIK